MKISTIAVALLAAATLALASMQAVAEPQRGGGMAATGQGSGPGMQRGGGMAATKQGSASSMQPGSRTAKTTMKAKKRMQAQPFCPYGKKSDGTCWVRCSQIICL